MSLSTAQKDALENQALRTFGGRLDTFPSGHGFRINRDVGQVAAIYWSENHLGNDVEIAICDGRLTEKYELRTVRRWIDLEQRLSGRACNVHKHGSGWPILGFTFNGAMDFLVRCTPLRRGFLAQEILEELNSAERAKHIDDGEELRLTLATLRPIARKSVIDLVKAAGIDVSCWYANKDGTRVSNPRSNPAYCFNWSFVGDIEPMIACLWHGNLKISEDKIIYDDNLRELARQLQAIADVSGESQDFKNRARAQARRAKALDTVLRIAFESGQSVRVIINEGLHRPGDKLGKESSKVESRKLDDVRWHVCEYDTETGRQRLVRDVAESTIMQTLNSSTQINSNTLHFVDQYNLHPNDSLLKESTRLEYARSRTVRNAALTRAEGFCELCGKKGFLTIAGEVFLETHHVVPLSEGGEDRIENVAALCPNDHREAHFGECSIAIREQLQSILADIYFSEELV